MQIIEGKQPDIALKKYRFSCDGENANVPHPLPGKNFFMVLCGRAGQGKSSILFNLLCRPGKMYNKQFHRVEVISPSLGSAVADPFGSLPEDQVRTELTADVLEEIMDSLEEDETCAIVIDDCVNDLAKDTDLQRSFSKLVMNRRHIGGGCSIFLTTQVYNKVPLAHRKAISHLIMMNGKQRKEIDSLYDEHVLIGKPDYYKILKHCFTGKHDFMFLDCEAPADKMFHHKFRPLHLQGEDYDESAAVPVPVV